MKNNYLLPLILSALLAFPIHADTFFGKTSDKQEVSLDAMKGKVVIVTFWATWCSYCREELPVLDKIQIIAGADKLAVVAINWKEDRKLYKKVVRLYKDSNIIFTHDRFGSIAKPYNLEGIPFLLMYDHTGELRYTHSGYGKKTLNVILEEVNGLFAEQAQALAQPASLETAE